jgi:hypothetical protein
MGATRTCTWKTTTLAWPNTTKQPRPPGTTTTRARHIHATLLYGTRAHTPPDLNHGTGVLLGMELLAGTPAPPHALQHAGRGVLSLFCVPGPHRSHERAGGQRTRHLSLDSDHSTAQYRHYVSIGPALPAAKRRVAAERHATAHPRATHGREQAPANSAAARLACETPPACGTRRSGTGPCPQ